MKRLLLCIGILLPLCAAAQLRWADSVLDFSTQYTTGSWAATQALGLPNTYPSCGDIQTAWASASADGQREFLELQFSGNGPVNTVQIYETNAAGAIDTVYVWNPNTSAWVSVYSAAAGVATCPRVLRIPFATTSYNVNRVRIAINSPAVSSWNEIDAVAIGNVSNGGVVTGDQVLCAIGATPAAFSSYVAAFPDSAGTPNYQWQLSQDSLAWTDISGANGLSYQPGAINAFDTLYYRRRAILGTDTAYSNGVTVWIPVTSANPAAVGQNAWILFGYNGTDINLSPANVVPRGYYVDSPLSFNTTVDWNQNASPSSVAGWQGCSVNADYFSMSAKRTGFTPGFYTFQMPFHDDPGMGIKNGQQIFYTGGCCGTSTVFNIGHLGANDTLEARFVEYGGGAGMQVVLTLLGLQGGSIGASTYELCRGDSTSINSVSGASGGAGDMFGAAYHYQWQDSLTNGSWVNISGATAAVYQTHAITDTAIYFRRRVMDDSGYNAYSNAIRIYTDSLRGNPNVWGINEWRFYAYNGLDMSLNPANVSYRGYYTDTALNFNTQNDWNAYTSPSTSTKYLGCPVQYDYFTMSMKRVGFPAGPYVISFPAHDDYVQVYHNGVLMLNAGCCNANPFASLGGLGANDTLEYRFGEQTSPAYLQSLLRQQALSGGIVSGDETVCGNTQPGLISNTESPSGGYAPATMTYQWQDSISGGAWTNVTGATALTFTPDTIHTNHYYRRMVSDASPATAYSNIVTKLHMDLAGNPADTGNNVWNVYGYQGTDINLGGGDVYKGFYIDSALNVNTMNYFCNGCAMNAYAGWQGCIIGADYFTAVFRRRGFPAGNYNVTVYHDDDLKVFKNGTQLYYNGCCPVNTVNLGFLNADSVVEFRLVEYGGGNFLQATFVKTDSAISNYRNSNCNNYSLANVAGNNWWDFTDDSGHVVASINPNGNSLGTVYLDMKHFGLDSISIPKTNSSHIYYMPRYYNWECSAYPTGNFPTPVTVRIYYKTSELDTYKHVTAQPALTAANLSIYHYDGINEDCNINNNANGPLLRSTTTNMFTPSGFYLEATIPHFSEVGVSGGTQALPLTLTDFDAARRGNVVALNWRTSTEYETKRFDVQRSNDGLNFSTIGSVDAAGTKTSPSLYSFTDNSPLPGRNFYRLLQTDISGRYEASAVRMVDMTKQANAGDVSVYPNPVTSELNIQLALTGEVTIRIATASGATVYEEKVTAANNTYVVNTKALPAGIYLVQVRDAEGRQWRQRVTKK